MGVFLALASPVRSQPQAARGRPALRVEGRVADGPHGFSVAELEALGEGDLVTRTPWTGDAVLRFGGVALERVLRRVRAEGDMLRAVALNDYAVTVPREDAERHGAFLATRQGGQPLRVRDRGPVWLIYPWTERPALDHPTYRERAIWQLRLIDVR
ncbi:MAG: hypothetical protein B7Z53_06550 [Rhodospirillales bacterium 12-71-4]|nr:MAG: hypothetical protein B7Z53_06550 [Rhodospirillales bacterium 12-71-4]